MEQQNLEAPVQEAAKSQQCAESSSWEVVSSSSPAADKAVDQSDDCVETFEAQQEQQGVMGADGLRYLCSPDQALDLSCCVCQKIAVPAKQSDEHLYCGSCAQESFANIKPLDKIIRGYDVLCPNKGCDFILKAGEVPDHRLICPYEQLRCQNSSLGCQALVPRSMLDTHQKTCAYASDESLVAHEIRRSLIDFRSLSSKVDKLLDSFDKSREAVNKREKDDCCSVDFQWIFNMQSLKVIYQQIQFWAQFQVPTPSTSHGQFGFRRFAQQQHIFGQSSFGNTTEALVLPSQPVLGSNSAPSLPEQELHRPTSRLDIFKLLPPLQTHNLPDQCYSQVKSWIAAVDMLHMVPYKESKHVELSWEVPSSFAELCKIDDQNYQSLVHSYISKFQSVLFDLVVDLVAQNFATCIKVTFPQQVMLSQHTSTRDPQMFAGDVHRLAEALQRTTSLTAFEFEGYPLDNEDAAILRDSLKTNGTLKSLALNIKDTIIKQSIVELLAQGSGRVEF